MFLPSFIPCHLRSIASTLNRFIIPPSLLDIDINGFLSNQYLCRHQCDKWLLSLWLDPCFFSISKISFFSSSRSQPPLRLLSFSSASSCLLPLSQLHPLSHCPPQCYVPRCYLNDQRAYDETCQWWRDGSCCNSGGTITNSTKSLWCRDSIT